VNATHFPFAPFNRTSHSDDVQRVPLVVVIDDEPSVADVVGYVLALHGLETRVAYGGEAGVQLVRDALPAAVVCDVRMPGFTGAQVVQALRADPQTSRIPVVFLSGQCEPHLLTLADAFHEKPFDGKELATTVKRLIAERAGGA
jgi:CheY-like chemotaxis protein